MWLLIHAQISVNLLVKGGPGGQNGCEIMDGNLRTFSFLNKNMNLMFDKSSTEYCSKGHNDREPALVYSR